MKRKFEEWLLLLWFSSFEGAKIRDGWRKHYADKERERIINLVAKLGDGKHCNIGDAPEHKDCWAYIEMPIGELVEKIREENK